MKPVEVERALIACCLIDPNAYAKIRLLVPSPRAFSDETNRRIYTAICKVFQAGDEIDAVTVSDALDKPDDVLISNATSATATSAHVGTYARQVRDHWMKRELKLIARSVADRDAEETADELISGMIDRLIKARSNVMGSEVINIGKEWLSYLIRFEERRKNPELSPVIPTGIPLVDYRIGGFRPGDYVAVIAGYSVGKSAFMVNLAYNAAKNAPVAIFSMEMTDEAIAARLIANAEGVNSQLITGGEAQLSDELYQYGLGNRNIFVDCQTGISAIDIRGKVSTLAAQHGVKVFFIDHIGLMKWHTKRSGDVENWKQVSVELKRIAKDFGVTMVILNQLDKESIKQGRPRLESSRMIGSDDPDVVLALYRKSWQEEVIERCQLEVIIRKARDGRLGTVYCDYYPAFHRIRQSENQSEEDFEPSREEEATW